MLATFILSLLLSTLPVPSRVALIAEAPTVRLSVEERLALHLRRTSARMYGAFWCPACTQQKELFGEAFRRIEYIECDPRGENPKPELCRQAQIRVYPTWIINGKRYEGVRSLEELAKLSGFKK